MKVAEIIVITNLFLISYHSHSNFYHLSHSNVTYLTYLNFSYLNFLTLIWLAITIFLVIYFVFVNLFWFYYLIIFQFINLFSKFSLRFPFLGLLHSYIPNLMIIFLTFRFNLHSFVLAFFFYLRKSLSSEYLW